MDNIMEIAIDLSPQKHIWTTPFWLHSPGFAPYACGHHHPRARTPTTGTPSSRPCDHFGEFITALAHIPQILEKTPVFLWGKLPCHDSLVLLLKLDYTKTQYFQRTPHDHLHLCSQLPWRFPARHPYGWGHSTKLLEGHRGFRLLSQPGLLLLLLSGSQPHLRQTDQSGHYTSADSRTPMRPSRGMWIWRSLLHPPVLRGWRVLLPPVPALRCAHRGTSLSDAIASHFYDVVRNRSDQRYKCRTSSSQIQYAGLFIRTDELPSYGLRRSDVPL